MFSKKNKEIENAYFEKLYCKGFNVGSRIVQSITKEKRELTRELLHLMVTSKPKDIVFQGMFSGYCFQIEQERSIERMKEIDKINEKTKDREQERGR